MATSANSKAKIQAQFSLKHRLIGAGILISFGVLVLPWLLGSYSTEQKTTAVETEQKVKPSSIATLATKAASKTVNNKESNKSLNAEDKKDVKVFVSRVQPLQQENNKPKEVKPAVSGSTKAVKQKVDSKKSPPKPADKAIAKKTEQKKPAEPVKKKAEPKKPKVETPTPKKATAKKVAPVANKQEVERGYIVSVGVFGDAKNVKKMVSDLESKKFNPSVRKENFNGKSVNRIYMGPFKTRAEAGKVKLRLSEKQNIPSLIKEFP